jgi:hypothetical protein
MPTTETVTEYGAVGDGETADTAAIQSAVDACGDAGGGTVHVPAGTYRTGTLFFRDDVTLELDGGATLLGSTDPESYAAGDAPLTALLVATGCENVALVGDGTVDANGTAFMRMDTRLDPADDPALAGGEYRPRQSDPLRFLSPEEESEPGDGPLAVGEWRPDRTLLVHDCESVRLEGVTIRNAPHWTVHLLGCRGVHVQGVDIDNDLRVPNSDGINPEHTSDVTISDCHIHTGDDAISPKAGRKFDVEGPTENVTVTNCTLTSRSCAIKFGSGSVDDMRDHTYSNVVIRNSNRGLGIQHRGPGDVENVLFSDVTIETRLHTGNWWGQAEPIHVSSVPREPGTELGSVRNVRFRNVLARGEGGVVVQGTEGNVEGVSFDGLDLRMRDSDLADVRGGNLDLRPTSTRAAIEAHDVPALYASGVRGLDCHRVSVAWTADPPAYYTSGVACVDCRDVEVDGFRGRGAGGAPAVALTDCTAATVRDSRAAPGTETFLSVEGTEGRLFVDNDLSEAERGVAGSAGFTREGNRE